MVNDKIYGKNDQFFLDYIDKDNKKTPEMPRHCLHSSKVDFTLGSEIFSVGVGMPEDMDEIWQASEPVGTRTPTRPC